MAQQNALIQEALDQSYLWRLWSSWRNGMPEKPVRNVIGAKVAEAAQAAAQPVTGFPIPEEMKPMGLIPKMLIGATMLGGAGVAGGAIHHLVTKDEPPAVVETEEPKDGDLLKYLRQQGYHVPPEAKR